MKENISLFSTKIIQIGLVLIAFLIPLFFLPTTSEFYNFNKTTLLVVASFFLFFVWGLKMVAEQRVRITRTPLDIPLLIFLAVYTVGTLFSIDPVVSVLGWHPTFFGSLPSVGAVIILYFLATTHFDPTHRKAIYIALVASASLLALLYISNYLGYFIIDTPYAKLRVWTPAGDISKLAAFLAVSIPLSVSLALSFRDITIRYLIIGLAGLQIIAFALINSLFAYLPLIIAAIYVALFSPSIKLKQEEKISLGILAALAISFILLVNIKGLGDSIIKPLIKGNDKNISVSKPIRLPLADAWKTSAQSLSERPLFGAGPSTFGLVFPSFKPLSLNTRNENNLWNIRFDQPGSGLLEILATTGALGTIAFLLILIVFGRNLLTIVKDQRDEHNKSLLLLKASLFSAMITIILFDLSAISLTVFFLLAAAYYTNLRDLGSTIASEIDLQLVALKSGVFRTVDPSPRAAPNSLGWIFLVPAALLFAGIVFLSWNTYAAEFYYQKAIVASQENKPKDTLNNLAAAIKANPYRDTYHRALLVTDLALARALNQKGKLSQDEQNTLLALVRDAIEQGRIITGYEGKGLARFSIKRVPGTLSSNVANWESLATVYSNIGGQLRNDAAVHAINTFAQAIRLDPTNPRLYEALGNVYFNLGDVDNATENFKKAISVKPDYASAHYNLAQALKRKGDNPAGVVNELTATLQLLEDNERNKENRERIQKELQDAQETLNKEQAKQQQQQQQQQATPSAKPQR